MIFGSKPKTGTALIEETIGQFESFAAKLEAGAQQNAAQEAANDESIAALLAANKALNAARFRATSVADKLRALVS
jgi:hypothetical protein